MTYAEQETALGAAMLAAVRAEGHRKALPPDSPAHRSAAAEARRSIVLRRHQEGMTPAAIAESMRVSRGRVHNDLSQLRIEGRL